MRVLWQWHIKFRLLPIAGPNGLNPENDRLTHRTKTLINTLAAHDRLEFCALHEIRARAHACGTWSSRTNSKVSSLTKVRSGSWGENLAASITRPHHPGNRKSFVFLSKSASRHRLKCKAQFAVIDYSVAW